MEIRQKLLTIQQKLNAPKDQFNQFGKYHYRSAESILQAVKPLLDETKTVLILSDEIVEISGRVYIKAKAQLIDTEQAGSIDTISYAREEETKKGMDGSQVTGASSSYARKYALNGLFCIDDNKDSDFTNQTEKQPKDAQKPQNAKVQGQSKKAPQKPVKEPTEAPDGYYYCENCGQIISGVQLKNGNQMSPKEMAQYTLKRFDRQLCKACCETVNESKAD